MRKNVFVSILLALTFVFGAFGLAACGNNGGSSDNGDSNEEHEDSAKGGNEETSSAAVKLTEQEWKESIQATQNAVNFVEEITLTADDSVSNMVVARDDEKASWDAMITASSEVVFSDHVCFDFSSLNPDCFIVYHSQTNGEGMIVAYGHDVWNDMDIFGIGDVLRFEYCLFSDIVDMYAYFTFDEENNIYTAEWEQDAVGVTYAIAFENGKASTISIDYGDSCVFICFEYGTAEITLPSAR